MGLETTQMFATTFHGMSRHMPEGVAFKQRCEEVGGKPAVAERVRGYLLE
jgi:enoyl-CoA hydratase